ncbi:MAG: DUF998 domain-containing protein [Promethearchaeota archaeon]|jgi:hypothetical membrane protein
MLSKQVSSELTVSLEKLFPKCTQEFLEPFRSLMDAELKHELHLDFEIVERKRNKVNPILRLAKPDDAKEIIAIYKELYNGTYPYKEMEDENEVRNMILDPKIQWIIYQDPTYKIAGCITFVLDYDNKRGYIRGFMLKKKYQRNIDITKAMIGSMLAMLHKYKDIIYIWYVENRTAHAKSQYSMWVCGIAPVGFYPNKDIFLGKVESDLMQILYDERALKKYRSETIPTIISEVSSCFHYSSNRYDLGTYSEENPKIKLNKRRVNKIKTQLKKSAVKDKFGYEEITLTLKGSSSYFTFLYTPQVQNFEKTKYNVENLEELYVFVQEFLQCKKELGVRYCEVFISAYNPQHQQIFYDAGFMPRGYVPSWNYSTNRECFEDSVLFNMFDGNMNKDIKLIKQGQELLQTIGVAKFSEMIGCVEVNNPKPHFKCPPVELLDTISLLKSHKVCRISLLSAMWTYLSLLFISLLVAMRFGFRITTHTISDLGNSYFTPFPFIFDYACIIAGLITVIYNLLISNHQKGSKFGSITSYSGLISGIVGGIGYFLIGVFSLDRPGSDGFYHGICAILAFTGFVFSIFFFSLRSLIQDCISSKLVGMSGIIIPLSLLLLNVIFVTPFLEWMLMFSILLYIVPLNYSSLTK